MVFIRKNIYIHANCLNLNSARVFVRQKYVSDSFILCTTMRSMIKLSLHYMWSNRSSYTTSGCNQSSNDNRAWFHAIHTQSLNL